MIKLETWAAVMEKLSTMVGIEFMVDVLPDTHTINQLHECVEGDRPISEADISMMRYIHRDHRLTDDYELPSEQPVVAADVVTRYNPYEPHNLHVSIPAIHALMECPVCKDGRGNSRLHFPVESTVIFGPKGWESIDGPQLQLNACGDPIIICEGCGSKLPLWKYLTDKKDPPSIEIENLIESVVLSIREEPLGLPVQLRVM